MKLFLPLVALTFLATTSLATTAARADAGSLAAAGPIDALRLDSALLRDTAAKLIEEGVGSGEQASVGLPMLALDTQASSVAAARGSGGGLGIGLQVGTPTALTLKFGQGTGLVLGIGVGFGSGAFNRFEGVSLHLDYLFNIATLVDTGSVDLSAYIGPGLWVVVGGPGYGYLGNYVFVRGFDALGIGARMPLGLSLKFGVPLEIYLELDPALFVFPSISGFIGGSLGFRWYF